MSPPAPGDPAQAGPFVIEDAEAMRALGAGLAGLLVPGDLVVLDGPLGAGKTTLAQGIGEGLGVRGPVTSPTFVIARVHPSLIGGPPLVHVDAYRLGSALEIDDLDLDATLEESVTLVEWGQGRVEALAEDRLVITIDRPAAADDEPDRRVVRLRGVGPRWRTLPATLPTTPPTTPPATPPPTDTAAAPRSSPE